MELGNIRNGLRLYGVTLNQVRKRFCVDDENNWALHRTMTIGKA